MSYKRKIEFKEKYVQVEISGEVNIQSELETWKKIRKECVKHKCYNVLGITRKNTNPFGVLDAYEYPRILEEAGIDSKYSIVWVNEDLEIYKRGKLAVIVMRNYGVGYSCQTFSNVSDAKKWLLEK